jgi:hypothetical protein
MKFMVPSFLEGGAKLKRGRDGADVIIADQKGSNEN